MTQIYAKSSPKQTRQDGIDHGLINDSEKTEKAEANRLGLL
jgi:hypothetical protein